MDKEGELPRETPLPKQRWPWGDLPGAPAPEVGPQETAVRTDP